MDHNERKAAARKLARQVSIMSADQRSEFARRFPAIITIEGRALSPFNTCLVAMQNPGATVVRGLSAVDQGRARRHERRAPDLRALKVNEIIRMYDNQISFIGIAETLDVSVKVVLDILRAAGRIWESR